MSQHLPASQSSRKLIYLVASTLDGRIAGAGGGFDLFSRVGDDHFADYLAALREFGAVVMGKATYEVGLRQGVTDPYPFLETYVLSATLPELTDAKIHLIREASIPFVRQLKSGEGRDIYLCGGAKLAASLLEAGLIDELHLKLNPLLMGDGIPMFQSVATPVVLELLSHRVYANGVVVLQYRVPAAAKGD